MKIPPIIEDSLEMLETPYLVIDPKKAVKNYRKLLMSFRSGDVVVYYAVKANSHSDFIRLLNAEGSSFDVASMG